MSLAQHVCCCPTAPHCLCFLPPCQVNSVGLVRQLFFPGVVVPEVTAGSAGDRAGLRPGDLLLAVDGRPLPASEGAVASVVTAVKGSVGEPVRLLVQRGGAQAGPDAGVEAPH